MIDQEFLREISIYRPYPTEAPLELLEPGLSQGLFDDALAALEEPARPVGQRGPMRVQELLFLRVAKLGEGDTQQAVAAYVVRAQNATSFVLQHLLIAPPFRHRGLGRWLMGHAIGLAESKGARELVVKELGDNAQTNTAFLLRYGFVPVGDATLPTELRYGFTPE